MPLSAATHAEALFAGTLCLMSCYARAPLAAHAERVAENLALLADNIAVSPEMRTICRRLAERWDAIAMEAPRATGGAPASARDLH